MGQVTDEEQMARNLEETLDYPYGCLKVEFLVSKTEGIIVDIKDLRESEDEKCQFKV